MIFCSPGHVNAVCQKEMQPIMRITEKRNILSRVSTMLLSWATSREKSEKSVWEAGSRDALPLKQYELTN